MIEILIALLIITASALIGFSIDFVWEKALPALFWTIGALGGFLGGLFLTIGMFILTVK